MVGPRHAAAAAAVALVFSLTAASCVAVVGADDSDKMSAVDALCDCLEVRSPGLLGGPPACKVIVAERLSNATDEAREKWMVKFRDLRCYLCTSDNPLTCYQTVPTCSVSRCEEPRECCAGSTCDEKTKLCVSVNP